MSLHARPPPLEPPGEGVLMQQPQPPPPPAHHHHHHYQQQQQSQQQQGGASAARDSAAQIERLLDEARAHYRAGRFHEALAIGEQVRRTFDPHHVGTLLLLSAACFRLTAYLPCLAYAQECIRLAPHCAEAYLRVGNCMRVMGDLPAAASAYEQALACSSHNGGEGAAAGGQQQHIYLDLYATLAEIYRAMGQHHEAKRCYAEAVRHRPSHAPAWTGLAAVAKEEGDPALALACYQEALQLEPSPDVLSNVGTLYKELGRVAEAIGCYKAAIALEPCHSVAIGNLGSCLLDQGEVDLALETLEHALRLQPHADVLNNIGNALREKGQLDEAIASYKQALQLRPDHAHAYNNLGCGLKAKGLVQEATQCYATAVQLSPRLAPAHSNLASALKEQGQVEQALVHYRQAIVIDPFFADAHSNLGNLLKDLRCLDHAIHCYITAIQIRPSFADAWANLAGAYKDGGQVVEAIQAYRQAIALQPDSHDARANLIHSLVFVCDWATRDEDFASLSAMLREQLGGGDDLDGEGGGAAGRDSDAGSSTSSSASWPSSSLPSSSSSDALDPTRFVLPSVQPFHALTYPLSLKEMLAIARRYAQRALLNVRCLGLTPFYPYDPAAAGAGRRKDTGDGRIHIGYVSSDLGNHPLSHLMQSVFGLHDRRRFKVTCYALTSDDGSEWRRRIEAEAETFRDISALMGHGEAAKLIYEDGVDVLVNLNGYTGAGRNEVFALQPAPIQMSYMGFCGSTGAEYIQYMVADRTVIPPPCRPFYSERVVFMPHSYFVNDHRNSARQVLDDEAAAAAATATAGRDSDASTSSTSSGSSSSADGEAGPPTRAQYGLREGTFVFCNFNQLYKIDPAIFDAWMRILQRVPGSVLWLLRFPPAGEANIRAEAQRRGVSAERLHFNDVAPKDEHIRRGRLADLFLDTPGCNAHTTGCDALWSGLPVLTLMGSKMASRVAGSLVRAAGLPELVVESQEAYEALAVALATDPARLHALRRRLVETRESCPLFDTPRWVRNYEKGLQAVWARQRQGLGPADVVVREEDEEDSEDGGEE